MYSNEYGQVYTQTQPPQNNDPEKKGGHGKKAAGVVALLLAGILVGGGITYAVTSIPKEDVKEEAVVEDKDDSESVLKDIFGIEKEEAAEADEDEATSIEDIIESDSDISTGDLETTASDEPMSVAEIAEKCMSSVVAITNSGVTELRNIWGQTFTQQSRSAGSGIIIGQTDSELLILTNYHVVADNTTLSVVFSYEEGKEASDTDIINAVIKDYDANRDIAVIAVKMESLSSDTLSNITVATIGSSDDLVLGEQVVAIGNALGYGQSVTTGIVSALNRSFEGDGENSDNKYIQTDAAINPGNSGGAMFNLHGELVGVNSAKMGGSTIEGMGYAIPISDIELTVEHMMNSETRSVLPEDERGYLGVSVVDVTKDISRTYGLPQGVYISAIGSGSGAEAAGLKKEDIIIAVNGKPVRTTYELKEYLSYYGKGETVTVTVSYRSDDTYAEKDVDVVLGDSPSSQSLGE